jgi:hypothetical protein
VKSVTTDESNNIYVCGIFSGTCEFRHGNSTGTGTNFGSITASGWDGFVIKYNPSGTIQWVNRVAVSSTYDQITNIVYRNSTLAIHGAVNASCSASGFPLVQGPYVAKLNPANGNALWAYNCPTGGASSLVALNSKDYVYIDNGGNIYVHSTGSNGGIVYGLGSSITITTNTGSSVYCKYNNSGNLLWARATATSNNATRVIGRSIVADDNGNLYIAGEVSAAGSHTVYFPAVGSSKTIAVPVGNHGYIAKLDPLTGLCDWVRAQTGVQEIDLAVQQCNLLYATFRAWGGAVLNGTSSTLTLSNYGVYVAKFYNTGLLLSNASSIWYYANPTEFPHLHAWKASIDLINSFYGPCTFPLSAGGSVVLNTTGGRDILSATIKDVNPFATPSISLTSTPQLLCAGDPTTLNATITGNGGPFTISWNVYTGSAWIPYPGSVNSTTLPLTGTDYAPYVYYNTVINTNICAFQIVVTNCSGTSYTATTFFVVYSPITYGMTTSQTVCLNDLNPQAVFNVSAPNAWAFSWEVSCNGGASWSDLTGVSGYTGADSPTLTVTSVTLGHDGCLYRCVLEGNFCSDVTTVAALLDVVTACRLANPDGAGSDNTSATESLQPLKVYPNPADDQLTIAGIEGEAQITVLSLDGRVVMQQQWAAGMNTISVSELAPGSYFVQVQDQSGVRTEPFVKQ